MKNLFKIILLSGLLVTAACSDDSESVATGPAGPQQPNANLNWNYVNVNNQYTKPYGQVSVTNDANYNNFFKAAFNFATGGSYTDPSYNYNCSLDVWEFVFGGFELDDLTNCGGELDEHIEWLADEGTVVQLENISDTTVTLRLYMGSFLNFGGQIYQDQYVKVIDLQVTASRDADGSLVLDGFSFHLIGDPADDFLFTLYFEGNEFGTVRLRQP